MRYAVILTFIIGLLSPGLAWMLGFRAQAFENRAVQRWPEATWEAFRSADYFAQGGRYLVHHLPLRQSAVSARRKIMTSVFRAQATDRVVIGEEGFLFLRASMENWCGRQGTPWLARRVAATVNALSEQGKEILYVSIPDKYRIYSDYLPGSFRALGQCGIRVRDQYFRLLKREVGESLVDLAEPLERAARRSPNPVYIKADTHWTEESGLLMLRQVLGRYSLTVDASSLAEEQADPKNSDLAIQLGIQIPRTPSRFAVERKGVRMVDSSEIPTGGRQSIRVFRHAADDIGDLVDGRTLIIHDSYMIPVLKVFRSYFSEVTFIHWVDLTPFRLRKHGREADRIILASIDRLAFQRGNIIAGYLARELGAKPN